MGLCNMRIELKTFFRGRRKGDVVDWPDGLARELVARGIAAPAEEEVVERAVAPQRAETATLSGRAVGKKVSKR